MLHIEQIMIPWQPAFRCGIKIGFGRPIHGLYPKWASAEPAMALMNDPLQIQEIGITFEVPFAIVLGGVNVKDGFTAINIATDCRLVLA